MSKNNIKKVEIIPLQIKLNEPFVISKGPLTFATITVVKIFTDDLYGIGECCPYRTIHGETQEGTIGAAHKIANDIMGMDATEIYKIVHTMNRTLAGNASIKGAFDMALYDLNAKKVGLPLYRYLNGDANKVMYTDMTISLLEKNKMVDKALKYQKDGFPVLKVKLGRTPSSQDVERIKAIRSAIGDDLPLRIDANQGWNYIESIRALTAMADLGIEHCEAPIPASNFIDLQKLRAESPIAIMGDESVFTHQDAYRMLATQCIDLINIKLGKSGGICNAMKIASIAEAAGVYCQVGSFSESRLGITALAHFSMVWDNIIYFDMDSPLMLSFDPVQGGMIYHDDWRVTVTEQPGIGADYDADFLKSFKKEEVI
ncbi:MAG: dipeptide epimerase [Saprospiraceae bacterium]